MKLSEHQLYNSVCKELQCGYRLCYLFKHLCSFYFGGDSVMSSNKYMSLSLDSQTRLEAEVSRRFYFLGKCCFIWSPVISCFIKSNNGLLSFFLFPTCAIEKIGQIAFYSQILINDHIFSNCSFQFLFVIFYYFALKNVVLNHDICNLPLIQFQK